MTHFSTIVGYWVLTIVPAWFIARKAGFSPWWCLLVLIPPLALVALWLLAFVKWPAQEAPRA